MSTRGYRFSTNQSMMATIDHSICLKIFTFYFGIFLRFTSAYFCLCQWNACFPSQFSTISRHATNIAPKAFSSQSGDSWTKTLKRPKPRWFSALHGLLRVCYDRLFSRFQDVSSGWSFQMFRICSWTMKKFHSTCVFSNWDFRITKRNCPIKHSLLAHKISKCSTKKMWKIALTLTFTKAASTTAPATWRKCGSPKLRIRHGS